MEFPNKPELAIENYRDSEIKKVPGLAYISNYLNPDEQDDLLNIIDQQTWSIKDQRKFKNMDINMTIKMAFLWHHPLRDFARLGTEYCCQTGSR
jgi:hypothetical protein